MSKDINSDLLHSNGLYLPTRTVFMTGEIDSDLYEQVAKNLHILDSSEGTITIIMNSGGGEVLAGIGIYDLIKACRNYVRIYVSGCCMSMATVILQAADERISLPNAWHMIHIGTMSLSEDHAINSERWLAWSKKETDRTESIYWERIKQKRPRYKRADLTEMLKFDSIMDSKEMLDLGLIDRIEENIEYGG